MEELGRAVADAKAWHAVLIDWRWQTRTAMLDVPGVVYARQLAAQRRYSERGRTLVAKRASAAADCIPCKRLRQAVETELGVINGLDRLTAPGCHH